MCIKKKEWLHQMQPEHAPHLAEKHCHGTRTVSFLLILRGTPRRYPPPLFFLFLDRGHTADGPIAQPDLDAVGVGCRVRQDGGYHPAGRLSTPLILLPDDQDRRSDPDIRSVSAIHPLYMDGGGDTPAGEKVRVYPFTAFCDGESPYIRLLRQSAGGGCREWP